MKAETKEKTVLESNKIIAEFMGASEEWNDSRQGKMRLYVGVHGGRANCEAHELEYHSSWDWLMLAVEKIFTLPFDSIDGLRDYCSEGNTIFDPHAIGIQSTKQEVYTAVVIFIEWYNENKGVLKGSSHAHIDEDDARLLQEPTGSIGWENCIR